MGYRAEGVWSGGRMPWHGWVPCTAAVVAGAGKTHPAAVVHGRSGEELLGLPWRLPGFLIRCLTILKHVRMRYLRSQNAGGKKYLL